MAWGEHWKIHYENATILHQNTEYRKKIARGRKKFWDNLENRKEYSKRLRVRNIENWKNPEYRERKSKEISLANKEYIKKHPEVRQKLAKQGSATLKRLWQIPRYKALFNEKITAANKKRQANNTGRKKFINICKKVWQTYNRLNEKLYEKTREEIYPYGAATKWETGFDKYYNNNKERLLQELSVNHKIQKVEKINKKANVYDLTIDGSHNFALDAGIFVHNSMDGDSAAAMRYTEAKLRAISEELLADIEKQTVDWRENYDGSTKEPSVLPAKLPGLLLNGSMGIAVGMATSIPPHNLGEICDGITALIKNPDTNIEELCEIVQGPDFPTGGIIYNKKDIATAYATGRGGIVLRAKTDIQEKKSGLFQIIITEIPYQLNKATLIEKIANLVQEKKIEGIKDLRDETNKEGVRVVIELKKDAYPKKILNQLFKLTELQTTFHVNSLALVDGIQPKVLNLKNILEEFIKHRQEVVKRRAQFDLDKAKERAHILEGLKKALDKIDLVIKTIKASKDKDVAKTNLIKQFKFSERQAVAILEMRLQQLANLERKKIDDELKEKQKIIKDLETLLASKKKMLDLIKTETEEIKAKYADPRRTQIIARGVKDFSVEDLIPNEEALVMITTDGYIKRLPPDTFKSQGRGGKGVIGLTSKEEESVDDIKLVNTHDSMLFFTNRGRVFQLRAYDVPQASRTAKGHALVNFLQLAPNEKVTAVLSLENGKKEEIKYLVMCTSKGNIKKTPLEDFANVRRSGLIAIKLKTEDNLEWVKPSSGKDEIIIATKNGQAIRSKEKNVRAMGRTASGVRAIRLKSDDEVVSMDIFDGKEKGLEYITVSRLGLGKRTSLDQYKVQGRGGSGIKTMAKTAKTGDLVYAKVVSKNEAAEKDLLIMSQKGQVIRLSFKSISTSGRATQGVRLMRFKQSGDKVASVALL